MRNHFLAFCCSFLFLTTVVGQKGYELGAWVGGAVYYGDLNTTLSPRKPGLAGGLSAGNFNNRVSLRSSLR
ncbi:MAG: hypothetical protein U0V54_10105 [Saprospiraceae bacterium]